MAIRGASPAQGGEFALVPYLDLGEAPAGQSFMITQVGLSSPIQGEVDQSEWPTVLLRRTVVGAPIARWLQVPADPSKDIRAMDETEQADNLSLAESYYRNTRGEKGGRIRPGWLSSAFVAHFMEIDADGEAIQQGGRVNIQSIEIAAVQLALPALPETVEQYSPTPLRV